MKNKIIIHNYTELSDFVVMQHIMAIIDSGKISETKKGKQYCFATTFDKYEVTCTMRKNTHTFKIFYLEKGWQA